MTKDTSQLEKSDGPWYYEMHEVGFNYRITDFQCALGSSQLQKLDGFIEKRSAIASNYDEAFSNIIHLIIPESHRSVNHSYHLYPLQIKFAKLAISKQKFFNKMRASGINLQVHYIPVHLQPFYQKNFGFKLGDFPVAEDYYKRELSLPMYPELSNDDQVRVIENIIQNLDD